MGENEEITFRILLNGMLRELGNGKFYQGVPKYDLLTAKALQNSDYSLFMRFEMKKKNGLFLFAPVSYRSETLFMNTDLFCMVDHQNQEVLK